MTFNNKSEQSTQWFKGEDVARNFFKKKGGKYCQIDLLYENNAGDMFIVEVKNQEHFTSGGGCLFDWHGLPPYQFQERIRLAKKIWATPILFVIDEKQEAIFYQDMRMLDEWESFTTERNPRIIFPLENFTKKPLNV